MKAYGGVDVLIPLFWPRHYLEMSSQFHAAAGFTHEDGALDSLWIRGWVDSRTGLDDVEGRKFLTITGFELRPLGSPARSQSLYRIRSSGSLLHVCREDKLRFKIYA
jgi:hypothetical protein